MLDGSQSEAVLCIHGVCDSTNDGKCLMFWRSGTLPIWHHNNSGKCKCFTLLRIANIAKTRSFYFADGLEEALMKEREISPVDLVAEMLLYWRGILVSMLVGAVLLCGCGLGAVR